MNNKRCSVDQQINGQWTYQRTTEVVPSSGDSYRVKLLHGNTALARWNISYHRFPTSWQTRLVGGISTGVFWPVVAKLFSRIFFFHLHNISYPGRLVSRCLVSSTYVWCGLTLAVESSNNTSSMVSAQTQNFFSPCFDPPTTFHAGGGG
jgi:hypothetical protein